MTDQNRKIESYKLVTGKDDSAFCQRITSLLQEGYELLGSPSITALDDVEVKVAQAVVKYTR